MARQKYSGSKYMRAAKSFGSYQKSVYDAISNVDRGKIESIAIEDKESRKQKVFSMVGEGISLYDKLSEIKKTESTVEDSVSKYEEFTGDTVDYSKVSLGDVVKGDAKLTDYGKESFKFGDDTYTKEEMIAFGEKADTNKFNKMLGIEADDLKSPSHESSGWKYGQTTEDIQGIKDAKTADVDAKVKAGQERLQNWKDIESSAIAKEKEIMNSVSSRTEPKMRDVSSDVEAEEVEVPKVDAPELDIPGSHMGNRKGLDFGDIYGENSMWSKIGSLLKKPKEERLTEESIKEAGLDSESLASDEVEGAVSPSAYGDEMEKYLDKDWKFGEDMSADDYTLGFSGRDEESGTSSFNLYDRESGKDYGKMFDIMKSDDSPMGYTMGNKNTSFFGSQKIGEWGGLFENESLQNILKGYRSS